MIPKQLTRAPPLRRTVVARPPRAATEEGRSWWKAAFGLGLHLVFSTVPGMNFYHVNPCDILSSGAFHNGLLSEAGAAILQDPWGIAASLKAARQAPPSEGM